MNIIVSGGGTGGHIYPAITIIRTIQQKVPDARFLYVGTKRGLEADIIPKEGLPFTTVDIQGFERHLTADNILRAGRDAGIEVKPTCAPQFMRIAEQIGVQTRYTRGCLAGLTYCVVGSEGIVRACAYMTEDAGDVRKQPFDEIWRESPVFQKLRTQAYKGACGTCDYKGVCGGCRARAAYYHDGDILGQDNYCAWSRKNAQQAAASERQ